MYAGTVFGHMAASLSLVSAATSSAVWLGVSTPNARCWLQAGLEGKPTYAYVERGCNGRQQTFRSWPVAPGHVAHVRLEHRGSRWRVLIDGYISRWRRVRPAVSITTLETDGPAVARIDGRRVVAG